MGKTQHDQPERKNSQKQTATGKTQTSHPEHETERKNHQKQPTRRTTHASHQEHQPERKNSQKQTATGKTPTSHPDHETERKNHQKQPTRRTTHASHQEHKPERKTLQKQTTTRKTHPSHPGHELKLEDSLKPYRCNGCKEKGIGKRYRCKPCGFNLHEVCMFAMDEHTIEHEFFEDTFKIYDQPPKRKCNDKHCNEHYHKIYCDACGNLVQGFVYHCQKSKRDLHPCCSNLKNKLNVSGVEFQIHYGDVSGKCIWCEKKEIGDYSQVPGWTYVSEKKNFNIHVYCVTDMMVKVLAEVDKKRDTIVEARKNETKPYELLAMVNLERAIQAHKNRGKGKNNMYWSIVKILFKAIVSTLLGDPTGLLWLVVDITGN